MVHSGANLSPPQMGSVALTRKSLFRTQKLALDRLSRLRLNEEWPPHATGDCDHFNTLLFSSMQLELEKQGIVDSIQKSKWPPGSHPYILRWHIVLYRDAWQRRNGI